MQYLINNQQINDLASKLMNVEITNLVAGDETKIQQVAALLVEGFKQHWPDAWPDINAALTEVQASFD